MMSLMRSVTVVTVQRRWRPPIGSDHLLPPRKAESRTRSVHTLHTLFSLLKSTVTAVIGTTQRFYLLAPRPVTVNVTVWLGSVTLSQGAEDTRPTPRRSHTPSNFVTAPFSHLILYLPDCDSSPPSESTILTSSEPNPPVLKSLDSPSVTSNLIGLEGSIQKGAVIKGDPRLGLYAGNATTSLTVAPLSLEKVRNSEPPPSDGMALTCIGDAPFLRRMFIRSRVSLCGLWLKRDHPEVPLAALTKAVRVIKGIIAPTATSRHFGRLKRLQPPPSATPNNLRHFVKRPVELVGDAKRHLDESLAMQSGGRTICYARLARHE